MNFFKTRQGGAVVLAGAVAFGLLYGSHRTLSREAEKVTALNENVMNDLSVRRSTASNLYTVAQRYLSDGEKQMKRLAKDIEDSQGGDPESLSQLVTSAQAVVERLEQEELSEQDARYLSGFRTQLLSGQDTIARDPYTTAARTYNETVLGSFPARVLGPLTGVKKLPVYQ